MIRFPRDHDTLATPLFAPVSQWPVTAAGDLWVVHQPSQACRRDADLPTLGQLSLGPTSVTVAGCPACGGAGTLSVIDHAVHTYRTVVLPTFDTWRGDEGLDNTEIAMMVRRSLDPAWAAAAYGPQRLDVLPGIDALQVVDVEWHTSVRAWMRAEADHYIATQPAMAPDPRTPDTYLVVSTPYLRRYGGDCALPLFTPLAANDALFAFWVPADVADQVIQDAGSSHHHGGRLKGWATRLPDETGRALDDRGSWSAVLGVTVTDQDGVHLSDLLKASIRAVGVNI